MRAILGLAVLSVGSMVVAAPWAAAAPSDKTLSVSWAEAVWDAGDGTPATAVQVFEGTVDLGAGPEPFSFVSVVVPTTDGASQTNCTGPLDFRASLRKAAVRGDVSCADGRSLTVDLKWTALDPPKGGGAHAYGDEPATASGVTSDGTANLVPGPSSSASIGRQQVG
ncbi:MAG: hypothetical protein ACRDZ7_16030 [Acidimicrobiia bacterium]